MYHRIAKYSVHYIMLDPLKYTTRNIKTILHKLLLQEIR